MPDDLTKAYVAPNSRKAIEKRLIEIIMQEGWEETVRPAVFRLVVKEANGNPAYAEELLRACFNAPSLEEAQRIIAIECGSDPTRQILQLLTGVTDWQEIRPLLARIDDTQFNDTFLGSAAQFLAGRMQNENETSARRAWEVLAALLYPQNSHDPKAVFYAAVGRALWGGDL
ncbi:MAG: hypothetical protein J2P48_06880 [Alphaproteobacteria bacterium]|nr:hypothetical protein [Alphaproteobacteria bacterium]